MSRRNIRSTARADRLQMQVTAGAWRIAWILLAVAAMVVIYPWRLVENAEEVAEVQTLVNSMSDAHDSITAGASDVEEFTLGDDGFSGFRAVTPAGVPAVGLVAQSGDNCVVMHWTAPDIAQVGRLPPDQACDPAQILEVPVRPNDGYVPGTGPPFDVTPLVREARTAVWFVVALVVLAWIVIKATLDLVLIVLRPDHFFSED